MVKKVFVSLLLTLANYVVGQKMNLTESVCRDWPELGHYDISGDGKYIWYNVFTASGKDTLFFITSDNKSRLAIPGTISASFTSDSKFLVFKSTEGVGVLNTRTKDIKHFNGASGFLLPKMGNGRWLGVRKSDSLILVDLAQKDGAQYHGVKELIFNETGTVLVICENDSLHWVDLSKERADRTFPVKNPHLPTFDANGKGVVFFTGVDEDRNINVFQSNFERPHAIASNRSIGIPANYYITIDAPYFSVDGTLVFFKIKPKYRQVSENKDVVSEKVNVWSYKDIYLQSHQLNGAFGLLFNRSLYAMISTDGGVVKQLESKDSILAQKPEDTLAIISNVVNTDEIYYDASQFPTYQLLYVKNGRKKFFSPIFSKIFEMKFSTNRKFITWIDSSNSKIFCYNPVTESTHELTAGLESDERAIDKGRRIRLKYSIEGWLKDDESVLVAGGYDIWQIDPTGRKKNVNLTKNYGQVHQISFRIAVSPVELASMKSGDELLITGLEDATRKNGFFSVFISKEQLPRKKGNMEACISYYPSIYVFGPNPPIKAKYANIFLFQKQNASTSSNLMVTKDFSTVWAVSNIHPERIYKWMTSELVHWKTHDSRDLYGILYKPEMFDEGKKYPIIFTYYDILSNECNKFLLPGLSNGALNIPWYLNNDYVVFVPDIWERTGYSGQSALNSLESAAKYLTARYSWIDPERMGLQGHSFGGFETNYIVSHSQLFAAAQASSGVSNMLREYGDFAFGGVSLAALCETGQLNLGSHVWERPDIYIENSAFLSADKVNTPLLLMHGQADEAVPVNQSLEMFIALRRLHKPVWLLLYDDEGHTLGDPQVQLDFTLRQQQFFDYYLKGSLPPLWMTKGLPANLRKTESRLQIDTSITDGSKMK